MINGLSLIVYWLPGILGEMKLRHAQLINWPVVNDIHYVQNRCIATPSRVSYPAGHVTGWIRD